MKRTKGVKTIVKDNLCTGCGTCISICPTGALRLELNNKSGIYQPGETEIECKNCGLCLKVCPGLGVNMKILNEKIFGNDKVDEELGNYLNCYIGYSNDHDVRYHSSSGGLITEILLFALEKGVINGALVTKMREDKPLEPLPFIARTREEIIAASQSKCCPVPANIALKDILKSKEGEKFAVVGLPCHIQGIRKAAQILPELQEKIILYLGLFCYKGVSFLGNEFFFKDIGINIASVKKLDYRGDGWPGKMKIQLEKHQYVSPYKSFYKKFNFFEPWRCTLCPDHSCELSDVSFGDAWIPEILKTDNIGTSVIVSRSKCGEDILIRMLREKRIELVPISDHKIKESQGNFSWKKKNIRARIFVNKIFGKHLPVYSSAKEPIPPFKDIYICCLFYLMKLFASNRNFWFILRAYHRASDLSNNFH